MNIRKIYLECRQFNQIFALQLSCPVLKLVKLRQLQLKPYQFRIAFT